MSRRGNKERLTDGNAQLNAIDRGARHSVLGKDGDDSDDAKDPSR